jgi:protein tyrosine phosphatase (PTP) superfamily phosphohydrolase (DUF442 family)
MLTDIKKYYPITEMIASAGQPAEEQLKDIRDTGFEVIINLGLHDNPEYSLKDEAASVKALGMEYIHIPVLFKHPTRQNLDDFFKAMDEHKAKKIFVHCALNKRASVFLGLYNIIRFKQSPAQAFEFIRKIWEPDKIWKAFFDKILNTYKV